MAFELALLAQSPDVIEGTKTLNESIFSNFALEIFYLPVTKVVQFSKICNPFGLMCKY